MKLYRYSVTFQTQPSATIEVEACNRHNAARMAIVHPSCPSNLPIPAGMTIGELSRSSLVAISNGKFSRNA